MKKKSSFWIVIASILAVGCENKPSEYATRIEKFDSTFITTYLICSNSKGTLALYEEKKNSSDSVIDMMLFYDSPHVFFSWNPLKNPRCYNYRLSDRNGIIVAADYFEDSTVSHAYGNPGLRLDSIWHEKDSSVYFLTFPYLPYFHRSSKLFFINSKNIVVDSFKIEGLPTSICSFVVKSNNLLVKGIRTNTVTTANVTKKTYYFDNEYSVDTIHHARAFTKDDCKFSKFVFPLWK